MRPRKSTAALAAGPEDPEADREFWKVMWSGPVADMDTLLLGRRTYEAWASFRSGLVDSDSEHWRDSARFSTKVEKVVFSKTLEKTSWSNSRVVRDPVTKETSRLRALPGKSMIVAGGVQLVRSVLAEDLADELCLTVSQSLIGRGLPLFEMEPTPDHHDDVVLPKAPGRPDLRLLESRALRSRAFHLRYATSAKGPPKCATA